MAQKLLYNAKYNLHKARLMPTIAYIINNLTKVFIRCVDSIDNTITWR